MAPSFFTSRRRMVAFAFKLRGLFPLARRPSMNRSAYLRQQLSWIELPISFQSHWFALG
ncbi:MAG: hypothetical protein ACXWK6_04310 [Myxococcaceae bacterium]